MLQKLNERIQGVVAWIVVVLIALTFTLFGVDYYMQTHQSSNAKVVVNGEPLTTQAYEVNYRRARGQQDIEHMSAAADKLLQAQVLNQMVTNEVTVQSALQHGFKISTEQANGAILSIAQFQEDGHFSSERYQQALNAALFTPESFQNEVKQGMLLNQQRFAFVGSSFVLPSEIDRFIRLYMQTRDYDYLVIPAHTLEKQIKITAEQIALYYKENQKEFMSPEQVSLEYVRLSMNDIRAKINISDEDTQRYYNDNKNNYLTPAQWKVAHILFAVPENATLEEKDAIQKKAEEAYEQLQKNPEEFNKLLSLSDDKLSLAQHGELPWIIAGQTQYNKSLSTLTKVGQISAPEETKLGYELFKLIDYKPVTMKNFSDMKATIKEQLVADMAQNQYAQALEQLSDLSYQTPDSLVSASQALHLPIEETKPFSRAGSDADILMQNKQLLKTAFNHDVLELGNNSEPIQLDNDSVVVVRVKTHIATKQLGLEQVQQQISSALMKEESQKQAKELGELLVQSDDKVKQTEVMKNYHLAWKSVDKASRDNSAEGISLINETAFNMLQPQNRTGVILDNGDYAVVALKNVNDGVLSELDKEQQESLTQQIEASFGMMDYDLYIHHLVSQAKIEKN